MYSSELCGKIVTISSFLVIPMCISMMSNTVLNSMNCEKRTLLYFSIGAAANILCIVLLTSKIGVYSYICGIACSNIISAVLNLRLLKKMCGNTEVNRYVAKGVAATLVSCLFGGLATGVLNRFLPPLALIMVCAPLILAFTAAIAYLLKMYSVKPLKKLISKS